LHELDVARSLLMAAAMMKHAAVLILLVGCTVGEDEATDGTAGVSVSNPDRRGLTGCHGQASTSIPATGKYVLTTFGGPGDHQSMSCGGFADGTTWYAASRQRYGCGSKLKIEANGKCAVVTALDYGPDVCVENAAGMPIMDVSPKVSSLLFGEAGAGWSDHLVVTVTEVADNTPTGVCSAMPPPPMGTTTCSSATLARDVEQGVCVQSATDQKWYACDAGAWAPRSSSAGCTEAYGFCQSATLGIAVAPRTCVQAASNNTWYQCNGQGWVTPVSVSTQQGPIGACASMNPL
jgi:hypothetical protein